MSDVRGLPQSVLQVSQMDRAQDMQQKQAVVDQRLAGAQFSRKVDEKRQQVQDVQRAESDALDPDGGGLGSQGRAEDGAEGQAQAESQPAPHEPDLGSQIDLKA